MITEIQDENQRMITMNIANQLMKNTVLPVNSASLQVRKHAMFQIMWHQLMKKAVIPVTCADLQQQWNAGCIIMFVVFITESNMHVIGANLKVQALDDWHSILVFFRDSFF